MRNGLAGGFEQTGRHRLLREMDRQGVSDHYPDFQGFHVPFVEANDLLVLQYAKNAAVHEALFDEAEQLPNFNGENR